ncbi:MAG: choice-of-anchor R domain-containing protein [Terriglobales bacterium]
MKKPQMIVCLTVFCNLTLFAQTGSSPRMVRTAEGSAVHVLPQEIPAGLQKIYGNLGSKTDPYSTVGWEIAGPKNKDYTVFIGMPFTPKSNSHVSQVQVALQYLSGANQVNLSIYGDSSGAPGTLLAGPVTVTDLPESGTCCTLAIASFTPVAVTGGTQYWVVADTPPTGTGSNFVGTWREVVKPFIPMAFNEGGSGWYGTNADNLVAGEVLGIIP